MELNSGSCKALGQVAKRADAPKSEADINEWRYAAKSLRLDRDVRRFWQRTALRAMQAARRRNGNDGCATNEGAKRHFGRQLFDLQNRKAPRTSLNRGFHGLQPTREVSFDT